MGMGAKDPGVGNEMGPIEDPGELGLLVLVLAFRAS